VSAENTLLNQYISVLITRLDRAYQYFDKGYYTKALENLKGAIRILPRYTNQEEEQIQSWLIEIDRIMEQPKKIQGHTRGETQFRQDLARAKLFKQLYQEVEYQIWGTLHQRGYFRFKGERGPFWDPSGGRKSGTSTHRGFPAEMDSDVR